MTMPRWVMAVSLLAGAPAGLGAQNSVYGVHGVGFPGRPWGAATRAMGGAIAMFDPLSAVNPASAAAHPQVTATATVGTEFRNYAVGGTVGDGIRSTRFPQALVGGRWLDGRIGFSLSFSGYAERTYSLATSDTIMLRGLPVGVDDRVVSDGGISDLRGAVAFSLVPGVFVGAAAHVLSGSSKLRVTRAFSDSAYRPFRQEGETGFSGYGGSIGVVFSPSTVLQLAAVGRVDGRLESTVDSVPAGSFGLPVTIGAAAMLNPTVAIRWSGSAMWRSWSNASGDLAAGTAAFDTWELATGVELGGGTRRAARLPLRLGLRYATLPFAPSGTDQPSEVGASIGTGFLFAGRRGLIDVSLERLWRDGAGASERAWTLTLGMTVRP